MDMMKFIKKMSKYKTTQEQLKLAMDITAAIANYRTELRKIPEDERYDKLRSPFPEARENDIRQYQLPSPRNKLAKNDPTPRNKPAKNDPEKFSKYCRDFDEELKRLQEIIASNSSNQELEIAHSVGIMGEAIRFMFEIDDQDYSLSDFFSQELLDDINHVRFVRNSQVMHGVFNYDANVVFRASDQNALSWKNDVEALSRIHQFIKIIKDKDPNALLAEAKLTNPDVTIAQVQARPISYLAGYYSRLEKYEDVEELIKEFDDFYAKISDDQKLEILQEKILIETLRSKIQYKNGDIPGATSTLEKALDIQGFQDDSVLADSLRIEKARIYNNLGYFCEENGDFKKAKDFFSRSSKLSRGHVLNLYSSCQYASILFYEEGKYREAIKIMGTAIRSEYARSGKIDSGNIYELMMAYRQIMLIQSEVGDSEKAEKTFKIYQELCSRTKLLKLSLGRNYKIVESIFMQDMAGESYNKGDYREAINNWQNAISLLNDVGVNSKTQSIGHCFLGIANSYKYLASSAKDGQERNRYRLLALEYYDNAQELAVQCNEQNSLFMAHCLSGSGQILQSLGRHDISRSVLKKAQEINKGHGNRGQYYQEKSNVSLRALDMNKYRGGRGVKYSKVAMQQDEELDNFQALAVNCMKANQFKDALFYLESDKAQIESEGSYSPVYATTLKNIIVCCCRLGKPGKAAQNCKILDDFLTKHPDCDNGKYREEVNSNMQSLGSSYKWSNKEQVISSNVRPSSVVAIIDFSKVIGNIKDRM